MYELDICFACMDIHTTKNLIRFLKQQIKFINELRQHNYFIGVIIEIQAFTENDHLWL